MGAQGKASTIADSMQRVKVYRLNDEGTWDDRGTGHVSVDYLEKSEALGLFVVDEDDNETLLVHHISSDEIYRRQEDTIISWQDPELSTELALSFQESMGCSYIWDQICSVQRNMQFSTITNLDVSSCPKETVQNLEPQELPPIELSSLPLIVKMIVESSASDQNHFTELILRDTLLVRSVKKGHEDMLISAKKDFFHKLMNLFRMCEDLGNAAELHLIFKLVKGIILLNSLPVFERLFSDEHMIDVIGVLEYDPDISEKQKHRSFLKEHVVFKEAIPIKSSSVVSKIHQTYRIGYIKDVILPRVLDEAVVANLSTIIHSNSNVIVTLLKDDTKFIQELFSRLTSPSTETDSKKNLVSFLHEFCTLAKSLQLVQQVQLFRDFVNEGVFDIIADVLQSQDKTLVLTGTDILLIFLNHDPNLLRAYISQQEGSGFLGLLVRGMTTDFGGNMHCQFLEIFRILLDSYSLATSQKDIILEIFYEKHMDHLIDIVASSCPPKGVSGSATALAGFDTRSVSQPDVLLNISELLYFCVNHHPYRIKCNFLHNNAIEKVLFLIRRRELSLVSSAVRFMRAIISRNDESLLRHVVKNKLLDPIVDKLAANGNRYNLLHSAIVELFDYIRKENLKPLITYTVECLWNQLEKFEYIETFRLLKLKYDQSLEVIQTKDTKGNMVDPRRRIDERALEKEEEEYFNDSDEEDSATAPVPTGSSQPGQLLQKVTSPVSAPSSGRPVGLVDYEDDEEDEDSLQDEAKHPSSLMCSNTDSSPKRKISYETTSDDEESVKRKKKSNRNSEDANVALPGASSRCNSIELPKKGIVAKQTLDKIDSSDELPSESAAAIQRGGCSCATSDVDTRQNHGEDCSLVPITHPSADLAVNGAKSGSPEPYPVR